MNASAPVRTGSDVPSDEMVEFLKKQLDRAHHQMEVKDRQIEALLERDHETNILIQGVVKALPSARKDSRDTVHEHPAYQGDNSQSNDARDAAQ